MPIRRIFSHISAYGQYQAARLPRSELSDLLKTES